MSDLVTHVFFTLVLVTAGGAVIVAFSGATDDLLTEAHVEWARARDAGDSRIRLESINHDATSSTTTLVVHNAGRSTLDLEVASLVLDGVPVTFSYTVEGVAGTNVWLRGENATITVTGITSAPTAASLALNNGRFTPFIFEIPSVHVANTRTFRGVTETSAFNPSHRITVKVSVEHANATAAVNATVHVEVHDTPDQSGTAVHTMTAVTDASGVAEFAWFRPSDLSATTGTWSVVTTNVTGSDLSYDGSADVDNPDTFTVS